MQVSLERYTEMPVEAIEAAARNCYDSKNTRPGTIMDHCYKSGHQSVLEFCTFTWHIDGISRACLAQLTRHRLASFAVRSQRYCNEDGFKFVVPPSILETDGAAELYYDTMEALQAAYTTLQGLGVPNEDARMVLPNACHTTLEVSMNLRSFIHFCNERCCNRAQWEIRELAYKMKHLVEAAIPQLKPYLVPKCEMHMGYPFCTEAKSCGRHKTLKEVYRNE